MKKEESGGKKLTIERVRNGRTDGDQRGTINTNVEIVVVLCSAIVLEVYTMNRAQADIAVLGASQLRGSTLKNIKLQTALGVLFNQGNTDGGVNGRSSEFVVMPSALSHRIGNVILGVDSIKSYRKGSEFQNRK